MKPINLRFKRVTFALAGRKRPLRGVVVTRIRGTRWMVESPYLPKQYARLLAGYDCRRIILDRSEFTVMP